jgi:hypothetical protein
VRALDLIAWDTLELVMYAREEPPAIDTPP